MAIILDTRLAETETDTGTVLTVKAGTTVQDGAVLVTVTDAGAACDCGKGLYCPENEQRTFSPKGNRRTIEWLAEHPVQSVHHQWEDGEQAEYDSLMMVGRRVYDQMRTQLGTGHVDTWLICRYEFGIKTAWEHAAQEEAARQQRGKRG